ncbi:hypothetical protein BGZ76_007124, partial [Entomortierella beljakovae]
MAGAAGLLALSTVINAGCDIELGFRVQYSDLAALGYVQLQVLDYENKVLIDNIDNSTREDWDSVRSKNVTWTVPSEWPEGDYTLRAFGDAYYTCKENGKRTFCPILLEDKEIIHIQHLAHEQTCPSTPDPTSIHESNDKSTKSTNSSTSTERENSKTTDHTDRSENTGIHIDVDASVLKLLRNESNSTVSEGKSLNSNEPTQSTQSNTSEQSGVNTGASKHKQLDNGATSSFGSGGMWTKFNLG